MTDKKIQSFQCKTCGSTAEGYENKPPVCCGEAMGPMNVCTSAPSAEHERPWNEDEPCDESTSGTRI